MSAIGTKRTCRAPRRMSAFGGKADIARTALSRFGSAQVDKEAQENALTGCSKRQQIVCRRKPKQIVCGLRRSGRLYVGPQRSALDYITG